MRTIRVKLYKFDELGDRAKEKAREWYRRAGDGDNSWAEFVLEDAKTIAGLLGFSNVDINYSGFWSQGDGASFTGTWEARDVKAAALRAHAPVDKVLAGIRKQMREYARAHRSNTARLIRTDHHYSHEGTVSVEADQDWEKLTEIARQFMKWIYRALEAEYNYQNSDEQVDETIRGNEYEFTEDGKHA